MTKCEIEKCDATANVTWHGKSYCWPHYDAARGTVPTPAGEATAFDGDYDYDVVWGI